MKPMLEDLLEKSKDLIAYPKDDEENWREEEITKLSARFQEEKDNFDSAQDKVSVEISCLATKNGEDEQEAIEAEAAGHQSLLLRFMHASGDLRALLRVISEEGEKSRDYPAKAAKVAAEQEHWAAEQKEHQLRMEQLQAEHEVKMEQLASDQRAIRLKEQEYQEKQEKQRTIEEKAERQRLEAVEEERQRIREVHNMEMRDREEQAQVKLRVLERGGSSSSHSADEGHQQVKLPNLELPKFNGNPQEWPMYEAGIKATVECQKVTDYQKYFLLKSSLVEGSAAATAFKGWSYSPDRGDNFETAFRHLKSRFGDPNVIIQSHLSELTKLTVKSANVKELRNFLDIMDIHLQSLRSLVPGFGEGGTEILLIYQLQTKLPHSVRTIMESHLIQSGETAWTFDLFRTQLLNYIKVKENVGEPERTGSDPLRGIGTVPSRYPEYPIPSAIPPHVDTSGYPGTSKSPITPTNPCIFCNDMHWSNGCGNYPTIASRRKKLYENNICVKCLKTGHMEKDCKSSTTCRFCQNPSHNRALCQENLTKYPVQKGTGSTLVSIQNAAAEENQTLKPPTDIVLMKTGSRSVLQTAWVEIRRPAYPRSVQTRVLLDSCSDCSYITLALAKQLNLPNLSREEEVEYSYYNFGSKKPCWNRYIPSEVDLVLKDKSILRIDVRIVDTITGAVPRYRIEDEDVIVALGNRDLADSVPRYTEREPVHFLIGQPAYMDIQTYRVEVKKNLFLQESKLGWILSGSIPVSEDDQKLPESTFLTLNNHSPVELPLFSNPDRVLTKMPNLTDFWDLQKIGISDDPQVIDEEEAQQQFDSKIEFRDDHRYYVPFPAKKGHDDLPENLELAKGRLISQVKRYQKKDPEILKKIDDIISDQLQKGVIEIVTVDTFEGPRKHYIPHHPVITPQKETTKVRLVYDASARTKVGSPSLNECLYKGAVILPDLAGVLLRSRVAPILMLSDIEKAFLQVGLLESDRDLTRFFWLRDFTQPPFGENVIVYRFCRVPFGVISSPYLLAATIRYHLSNVSTELANEIRKNIYVDNVMIAVKNHADAMDSYWKSKEIFNNCSMNLREWTSNCREVIDQIPAIDRAKGDTLKLLGLIWDCTNDIFYIPGSLKLLDLPCHSKRSLASSMAKVFDPLGYFSPVILRLKIILQQKVWSSKFDWDADLPEEIIEEWRTQLEDIKEISNHPIPRFIALHALPQPSYQLLCFTDASAQAYSTAVFLRGYTDSESRVNLIFSKSRLAPLQPLTIPRLELLGVLIGIRALQFVAAQLQMPIDFKCLWTDSKVVLGWLTSTKSLPKFVTNLLTEIKRLGKDTHFCYVPSEENPADIATRETTFAELKGCDMWWHGPAWLCHARKDWPNFNTPIISPENLNKLSQTQKPSFYQISLVTHH
ncbi:MAG: DUF1759 domain-containing protein, partial [Gammaproteobacteria bacterium]|nr:DUF1759 domain-containing protein [Gammaproteobacteria bacterium]